MNKVINALLGIVLVRILTKPEYGIYAYAFNIISFFVLFNGLGLSSAVLQVCSENHDRIDKVKAFYRHALNCGIVIELIMGGTIFAISCFVPLAIEGGSVVLGFYSLYPLAFYLYELKTIQLRVLLNNKGYAFASTFQTSCSALLSIAGAMMFHEYGLVLGQTMSFFVSYTVISIRYPLDTKTCLRLERNDLVDFWKISLISAVNNGLAQALSLIGTFLVGNQLGNDRLVAEYQVALMIPASIMFIPSMFMVYAYPQFARHRYDKRWTILSFAKILLGIGCVMLAISSAIAIFANPIVELLFGTDYLEIIPVLDVLLATYLIASLLKTPAGSLLITQRRLAASTIINLLSIVVCIVSSVVLIPRFQLIGAALSLMATIAIGGICSTVCYLAAIQRIKT